jgi:hypothetical protein
MKYKGPAVRGKRDKTLKQMRFPFEILPQENFKIKHTCGCLLDVCRINYGEIEAICGKCDRYVRVRLQEDISNV